MCCELRTLLAGLTLFFSLIGASGCRCCSWADTAYRKVDQINETKWCLDHKYKPCLDISRAGMPDWCECSWNQKLCSCRCNGGPCRPCPPAYPIEYTMKYYADMQEKEAAEAMPIPESSHKNEPVEE